MRLARDLAYRLILRGCFSRALPLSQEVLHHFSAPAELAMVWSDIARAAAGAGELEVFESAWAQSLVLIERGNLDPFTINIMLNLAHGAAFRGDALRSSLMANRALRLARERKEGSSVLEAEALLDSLRSQQVKRPSVLGVSRTSKQLVETFVRALQEERAAP